MLRSVLINKTVNSLSKLPDDKIQEVSDFTESILKKHEEEMLQKGIQKLVSESKTYQFLEEDDDLYSVSDLIEKY